MGLFYISGVVHGVQTRFVDRSLLVNVMSGIYSLYTAHHTIYIMSEV